MKTKEFIDIHDLNEGIESIINGAPFNPCDDCVSREEVIRIVNFHKEHEDGIFHINEDIERLPSVLPCGASMKGETDEIDN